MGSGFDGLTADMLHKIYKKKMEQLLYTRTNEGSIREKDILYELKQIERRLGKEDYSHVNLRSYQSKVYRSMVK